jgi:hypothetical protein
VALPRQSIVLAGPARVSELRLACAQQLLRMGERTQLMQQAGLPCLSRLSPHTVQRIFVLITTSVGKL